MRNLLFFILIIFSIFLLSKEKENEKKVENKNTTKKKEENKTSDKKEENKISDKKEKKKKNKKSKKKEQKKEEKKLIPPPPLSFISDIPKDTYNLLNDNVYNLNDDTIDRTLRNGNNYRWFVILYSETCGHCYFARTEIRKILPEYKYSSYLRFAEIEVNINPNINMRFNIGGVPYIFILQNNTMYIMDLYPSQKNLIKFIETPLTDFLPEEKKPFPPKAKINNFSWDNILSVFQDATNTINDLLKDYGFKIQLTPTILIFTIVMIFGFSCILEYFCCLKYCPDEEEIKPEKIKDKKEENNKDENEIEEKKEDEKIEEINKDKDLSEEEKIKREKEKEEKEKKNEEKKEDKNKNKKDEDKDNKNKKANKKKKKE